MVIVNAVNADGMDDGKALVGVSTMKREKGSPVPTLVLEGK